MDSLSLALIDSFENFADNKAILINDEFITYRELGALSQNLARIIKKHNFIFIFGYRSFETYISISASVLTHTAFIPLNPNFPQERLETMIKRVDCNALILCKECVESFKKIANFIKPCVVYCFDDFDFKDEFKQHTFIVINNALSADSTYTKESTPLESTPAYLLFTSGSTGIPKGVLVSRGNLFSYVKRIQKIYNFSKLDRISQFFDITFDLSMHDIFCSFLSGTTLVVIPKNQLLNPLKYINKTQLTVLFAPPSFIAYLQKLKILKENVLPNLRAALFCGEALPSASAIAFSKAAPQASLDNLYGPTEATISFTFYRVKEAGISNKIQDLKGEDIIPLGLPLCGLKISIRDAENREVRNGEIGEILLGSKENSQIALGYYKDIEKTKEKFFSENGVQWYKTGDLGYFNATLNAYCFKGRIDEQVKIQGYRVELLEVDKALQIISGVQSRAVLLSENGLSVLIGVIEGIQDDKKAVEILCGLKKKLPFYMIPQKILFLESFPLNSNGKVDREAIKIKIQNILNAIISVTPPPPEKNLLQYGAWLYAIAKQLYKIPRSLTGNGNRETLRILQESLQNIPLNIYEIPSGTQAFDWRVPNEWNVKDAYIITPEGKRICDFKENNLHLIGYSIPQDCKLTFSELESHLYYLKQYPNAIPYITSYYKERFGFCLSYNQYLELKEKYKDSKEKFHIKIDATLKSGFMSYGEIKIKGNSEKEIILSTYICHPQMANNELSGILIALALADILSKRENIYSYRILFLPETIGSIYYLSKHLDKLKNSCIAGFVLTCIGDNGPFSVLHSRSGDNLADRASSHILKHFYKNSKEYSYLERGSDERQYCAPLVDLPFCTLMRSKFGEYNEYHTSLDNLELLSAESLKDSLEYVLRILKAVELNGIYKITCPCEPQLSKYNLYPTLSTKDSFLAIKDMRNLLMYCDGKLDLLQIANICDFNLLEMESILNDFIKANLLIKESN